MSVSTSQVRDGISYWVRCPKMQNGWAEMNWALKMYPAECGHHHQCGSCKKRIRCYWASCRGRPDNICHTCDWCLDEK